MLGDDPRFLLSRASRRLGFYRNFERALALAPAGARYVALADQDDRWHPDKLATLLAELGDAQLVYSDARVVDGDGRVLADTYWGRRSNNHTDLLSLLVANSVTGAASLFPRVAARRRAAVPARASSRTSTTTGSRSSRSRSATSRSSSGRSTTTSSTAARRSATPPPTACRGCASGSRRVRRDPRERIRLWRMHYYVDVCRLLQFTAILRLRLLAADGAGQAPGARALRARGPLARRAGRARLAGRAGAAGPAPRHARRRVDARPRLRLAAAADGERPRRADRGSRASTRCRHPPSTRGPAPARPPSRPCA